MTKDELMSLVEQLKSFRDQHTEYEEEVDRVDDMIDQVMYEIRNK